METNTNTNHFATETRTDLVVGDAVLFTDPHDPEMGRCGRVTRVHSERELMSRRLRQTVFVECASGQHFHGRPTEFTKVTKFVASKHH